MSMIGRFNEYLRFARDNRRSTGRSLTDTLRDLFAIVRFDLSPSEFYDGGLYDGIPDGYMSSREYARLERCLNPRQTGVVNFDKWHQYLFFKAINAKTPEVFGFLAGRRGVLNGQSFSWNPESLLEFVDRLSKPVVVKPCGGGHGHGFDLIVDVSLESKTLTLRRGGKLGVVEFLERVSSDPEGLIFQEYVKQHPALTAFAPHAVNTLRVLTTLTEHGEVEFPSVILKMGRGLSLVDNVGAGGVAAHLNIETGALSCGFVWPGKQTYRMHPDSGVQIEGFIVPFWREALELAAHAHQNLTSARSLGWDVAVTTNGPILIEMNSFVAIPVYQRLGRSVRTGVFAARDQSR